jgi:hypothetical protein
MTYLLPTTVTQPPIPGQFICNTTVGGEVEFELFIDLEVKLALPATAGYLCTLHLERCDGSVIPVARAYDGNGWERAGGMFAAELNEWTCDAVECNAILPPSYENSNCQGKYVITTQANVVTAPPVEEDRARFYEAASFGVTTTC